MPRAVLSGLLAAGFAVLAGCTGGGPPAATALDASRAHVELAELQRGRTLLISKCGGCHRTPQPDERRAAAWPRELDEMSSRAHLDRAEHQVLERYLVTMAAR